jgi:hypothetical protein
LTAYRSGERFTCHNALDINPILAHPSFVERSSHVVQPPSAPDVRAFP